MSEDAIRTLVFAFRRKGVDAMERKTLLHLLAFDLRWLSPDPAKRLIERAVQAGLLHETEGTVRLAFDATSIEIPMNYRPPEDVADAPIDGGPTPAQASLWAQVEALLEARRRGEDVRDRAAALERRLLAS